MRPSELLTERFFGGNAIRFIFHTGYRRKGTNPINAVTIAHYLSAFLDILPCVFTEFR
jgi:hypothetical protein